MQLVIAHTLPQSWCTSSIEDIDFFERHDSCSHNASYLLFENYLAKIIVNLSKRCNSEEPFPASCQSLAWADKAVQTQHQGQLLPDERQPLREAELLG